MKQITYLRYRSACRSSDRRIMCDNHNIFDLILPGAPTLQPVINYDFLVQLVSASTEPMFDDEKYKVKNSLGVIPSRDVFSYFVPAVADHGLPTISHANRSNSIHRPIIWKATPTLPNW